MRAFSTLTIFTVASISLFASAAPIDSAGLRHANIPAIGKRQADVNAAAEVLVNPRDVPERRQVDVNAVAEAFVNGRDVPERRQADVNAAVGVLVNGRDVPERRQADVNAAAAVLVNGRGE